MASDYHKPVMLKECIEALNIHPEGTYVDATFGGGGHSLAMLEYIKGGKLIAFDQDEDAAREAKKITHRSFTFCRANFRYLKKFLKLNGILQVNGMLADLGISSHQIDEPVRGFSTRFDGPLDMRMDANNPLTAAEVLSNYTETELHRIFGMYGEIRNARTVARAIVQGRAVNRFATTADLKKFLASYAPKGKENKYFAQVFQALRIEVNNEMQALEDFLHQAGEVLVKGGRLVVMSYHSLEDRMVKNFINKGKVYGEADKDFFGNVLKPFEAVNRKPVEASEEEIKENKRARSAKLRIGEKK
jgi:16S rRNA (cytosine1402-N4)-methyltransferase